VGGDIGVGATCRRGRQWGTERCFIPCSGGSLRLSLGSSETVTLTAVRTRLSSSVDGQALLQLRTCPGRE